tara:strand:+ start:134 stop:478 length:345 start_codon:yes stop_codon:yes gene_type:complete
MTTENHNKPAGRPTLAQQADNAHENAEVRIDLAMAKAVPKVIKKLLAMVDNMDSQKDNINLTVIDKVLGHNKENRKAAKEILKAVSADVIEEEEEDYTMSISLSSSDDTNKSLN